MLIARSTIAYPTGRKPKSKNNVYDFVLCWNDKKKLHSLGRSVGPSQIAFWCYCTKMRPGIIRRATDVMSCLHVRYESPMLFSHGIFGRNKSCRKQPCVCVQFYAYLQFENPIVQPSKHLGSFEPMHEYRLFLSGQKKCSWLEIQVSGSPTFKTPGIDGGLKVTKTTTMSTGKSTLTTTMIWWRWRRRQRRRQVWLSRDHNKLLWKEVPPNTTSSTCEYRRK